MLCGHRLRGPVELRDWCAQLAVFHGFLAFFERFLPSVCERPDSGLGRCQSAVCGCAERPWHGNCKTLCVRLATLPGIRSAVSWCVSSKRHCPAAGTTQKGDRRSETHHRDHQALQAGRSAPSGDGPGNPGGDGHGSAGLWPPTWHALARSAMERFSCWGCRKCCAYAPAKWGQTPFERC